MRPIVIVLCGALVWAAAGAAAAAVPLDQPFPLTVGDSTVVGDDLLRVGFDSVLLDSRCPTGATCIWPGDAETDLWALVGSGPLGSFVLHTYPEFVRSWVVDGYRVTLLELAPYPVVDVPIDPATYVATLMVTAEPVGGAVASWGALKVLFR